MGVNVKKIIIFGAGKIGRSFIGQLFGTAGYQIVFIDVDPVLVALLNKRGSYPVFIKDQEEQLIQVSDVSAILASDHEKVIGEIVTAGLISVNVGKNALQKVVPLLAKGLISRMDQSPEEPLDIILAENMRDAAGFMLNELEKLLPVTFPVREYVGLIESSIGKMVPIMPLQELEKDPLMVYAEAYNELILDGNGFRSAIPDVAGLAPKTNIRAWVDRKAFIHNLGHAAVAYFGYFLHPDQVYLHEVLEDIKVFRFTRAVMLESADILAKCYPTDFKLEDLEAHTDDLIHRFRNKALNDTLYRVGQDLPRKLGDGDRFMGAIRLAIERKLPYDQIIRAMSYGFFFTARDETGVENPSDSLFLAKLKEDFEGTLFNILNFNKDTDASLVKQLFSLYQG